jgi:hypothetical protein
VRSKVCEADREETNTITVTTIILMIRSTERYLETMIGMSINE